MNDNLTDAIRGDRILIVNADDLGSTSGVNDGIFESHSQGIVTSATLMVGRSGAEDAARRLGAYPDLGVGLHVVLTGGRPLLPADAIPSLVDANGGLPRHRDGLSDIDPADVHAEITAQLERFEAMVGRLPTHLDGHHHCLRVDTVLEPMLDYARRHGIPIRRASESVAGRLEDCGIPTTDTFDEDFYAAGATLEDLLERLRTLPTGTHELMVHPGRVDGDLEATSTYTDEREREVEILTSGSVRQAILDADIRLATFANAPLRVPTSSGR